MNFSYIINLGKSQVMRHLTLVFTGNVTAAALGFLAILLISRKLTISDFGLFNIAISITLIASCISNLGIDTVMVRFASSYLYEKKKNEATQVLKVTLLIKIIIGSFLCGILFFSANFLSTKVFHLPGLTPLIKLAAFGGLSISLLNYLKSSLSVYQLFKKSVILQLFVDFSKLLIVMILIFSFKMNVFTAVAAFVFSPLLGVTLGFKQILRAFTSEKKPIMNLVRQLLSYSKWVFVSSTCKLTFPYIGLFMIAKLLNSEAAGIYGLALHLTYIFPIIIYSLQSVLLPRVSNFRDTTQFQKYIKDSLKISFYAGLSIIPIIFFSRKLILVFFGVQYLDSVSIFKWLLASNMIFTISSIIHMPLHSMNKPHLIAIVDVIRIAAVALGCYFLIPVFGVLAPAVVIFIINVCILVFYSTYILKRINNGMLIYQDRALIDL